jgi:antitoxin MazE
MKTAIQKWGNSLALRIPKTFAAEARIMEGAQVEMTAKAGTLVIKPLRRKRHSLDNLLRGVTRENRHKSIDTGAAVGREVW